MLMVCRNILRDVKGSTLEGLELAYPLWLVATSRSVRRLKSWIRGNGHEWSTIGTLTISTISYVLLKFLCIT